MSAPIFPKDLAKVEELLRSLFLHKKYFNCQVRGLSLKGVPGSQSLTVQLEFAEGIMAKFALEEALEDISTICINLRQTGFAVDELQQSFQRSQARFLSYWLIAYETS